jgi:hypothetical protein
MSAAGPSKALAPSGEAARSAASGAYISPPGCPKGEYRSAKRERTPPSP